MILEPGMKVEYAPTTPTRPLKLSSYGVVGCRRGTVYTVREILEYPFKDGPQAAIRLMEIRNPAIRWSNSDGSITEPREIAFAAKHFRPIRNRDTSIEIFREIVREVKTGAPREIMDA